MSEIILHMSVQLVSQLANGLAGGLAPLAQHARFIFFKLVPSTRRPGKFDKISIDKHGTAANAHDPAHWLSAAEALELLPTVPGATGIGFVLGEGCPFWCLDIDGCRQPDGTLSALAQGLLLMLAGCAVEISISGTGLHVWGSGELPPHRERNDALHLELYSAQSRRFIAITGALL